MLFAALPKALIVCLAGFALLRVIATNLTSVMAAADHREASVIAFLATASEMRFVGLDAALWGVVAGLMAYRILHVTGAAGAGGKI
jgi:benzoate membrane transport protein